MAAINLSETDAARLGTAILGLLEEDMLFKSVVLAVDADALDRVTPARLGQDVLELVSVGCLRAAAAELQRESAEQVLRELDVEPHGKPEIAEVDPLIDGVEKLRGIGK